MPGEGDIDTPGRQFIEVLAQIGRAPGVHQLPVPGRGTEREVRRRPAGPLHQQHPQAPCRIHRQLRKPVRDLIRRKGNVIEDDQQVRGCRCERGGRSGGKCPSIQEEGVPPPLAQLQAEFEGQPGFARAARARQCQPAPVLPGGLAERDQLGEDVIASMERDLARQEVEKPVATDLSLLRPQAGGGQEADRCAEFSDARLQGGDRSSVTCQVGLKVGPRLLRLGDDPDQIVLNDERAVGQEGADHHRQKAIGRILGGLHRHGLTEVRGVDEPDTGERDQALGGRAGARVQAAHDVGD